MFCCRMLLFRETVEEYFSKNTEKQYVHANISRYHVICVTIPDKTWEQTNKCLIYLQKKKEYFTILTFTLPCK